MGGRFGLPVPQPVAAQPVATQPATTTTQPTTTTKPATTTTQPATTQPVTTQPATTTTEPITTQALLRYNTAQEIITKQNNLIVELNTTLVNLKKSLNIPSSPTAPQTTNNRETFINMSSVSLNPNKDTEIYNYANIYNNNVALLDDPNKMNQLSFNTYINIQDNKLNNLKNELKALEIQIQSKTQTKNNIKSFKSMYNSQIINIELYDAANNNNAKTYPNYLLYGNNGCLEYNNEGTNDSPPIAPIWNFNSCDSNNSRQQFVSNKINNLESYNSHIDDNNKESILNDDSNIMFGFNIINPINDSTKCLQLNNDGVSVMPCNLKYDQRFKPSYNTVL